MALELEGPVEDCLAYGAGLWMAGVCERYLVVKNCAREKFLLPEFVNTLQEYL
jgi:hypothetical protein